MVNLATVNYTMTSGSSTRSLTFNDLGLPSVYLFSKFIIFGHYSHQISTIMKIKLPPIVSDMRGKLGNVVASTGRGGAYFREHVIPANPQTVAQTTVRSRITQFSQAWAGLTDNQRLLWNQAVSDWLNTGIFGDKMTPSGLNLYVALNCNLAMVGVAAITTPPTKAAVSGFTSFSAAQAHAGATTLTFAATPVPAGTTMVIFGTAPMSPGRSFVKSQYRIVTTLASAQTSPNTITTAYNAKFGGPGNATEKVFFKAFGINTTTGQAGAVMECSCIVS